MRRCTAGGQYGDSAQRAMDVAQTQGTAEPGVSGGRAGAEGLVAIPDQPYQPVRRLHVGSGTAGRTHRLQNQVFLKYQ